MAHLLTHHDPYHIHALCGLMGLLHFIYRLFLLFLDVDDSGFGKNLQMDILSMIIIILPNVTSFLFNIVRAKKGTDGFTIWKEYRWHAFIFAFKAWILNAFFLYQRHYLPETNGRLPNERYIRAAIEFFTLVAAKVATDMYPPQESTIRGMYKTSFTIFLAGFMQFLGRAAYLCGMPPDDINLNIFSIFVIQFNAFNMTLRKKRKIGPRTAQMIYSALLSTGFYTFAIRRFVTDPPTGFFDPRFKFIYLASVAYYIRRQGMDRFTTWLLAMLCTEVVSKQFGLF